MPNHHATATEPARPPGAGEPPGFADEGMVTLVERTDAGTPGSGAPDPYDRGAVDARLGPSTSPRQFARKAQFVRYEGMRARYEAWHAHPWPGPGALPLGMPYPALPSTAWPSREDDLDGAYYGARKGAEPLHIQAEPADSGEPCWQVRVVNLTAEPVPGARISACLYGLGGRPLAGPRTAAGVDLAPASTSAVLLVPFDRSLPATHLLRLRLADAAGRPLSANDYVRCRTPTDMRSLNGLPAVPLALTARRSGRTAVSATVHNTGTAPAAMVRLSLVDPASGGNRLLPAVADDNYVWLLPGESRRITLSWATGVRTAATPRVVAEAYNAGRVTATL